MVTVLDTHVFLWAVAEPRRLSRAADKALRASTRRMLADVSLREVALLAEQGRITLHQDTAEWLQQALEQLDVEVVPISPRIAARSTRVAQHFHGDPADQLIAATAIEFDVPLITADEQLRASPAVRTIW